MTAYNKKIIRYEKCYDGKIIIYYIIYLYIVCFIKYNHTYDINTLNKIL